MTETHHPAINRAIVLLSGGIDSATTAALAIAEGYEVLAVSFDYGQRHRHELKAARAVGRALQLRQHLFFPIDLTTIGGSALTANIRVPKGRSESDRSKQIPITYVPARNTIFLSVALAWAETLGANAVFIGANSVDYSGYPDCRPEFIEAFQTMANLATRSGVEGRRISVRAPLINFRKSQIIREGLRLGVDYSLTLSCYDPDVSGRACGECDSCLIRRRGFAEAGVPDPARYIPAPYPT